MVVLQTRRSLRRRSFTDPEVHLSLNLGTEDFWGSQVAASRTENLEVLVEQPCPGVPYAAERMPREGGSHYRLTGQLTELEFESAKVLMQNNSTKYYEFYE